jgi:hypothetical protein
MHLCGAELQEQIMCLVCSYHFTFEFMFMFLLSEGLAYLSKFTLYILASSL